MKHVLDRIGFVGLVKSKIIFKGTFKDNNLYNCRSFDKIAGITIKLKPLTF